MERTLKENEYEDYYETELRDYHIPKKNPNDSISKEVTKMDSPNNGMQTPLANSYYNCFSYDSSSYYGNYPQSHYYSQMEGVIKPAIVLPLPPPPPPPPPEEPLPEEVKSIEQAICTSLKDYKEKPKIYKPGIYQATVPDIMDDSLPKELKLLFQPLYCKLCSAQLSSNQVAKMHYKSKNHEKKIKKWLQDYSEKTGEPLHKRARLSNEKQLMEAAKNPNWYHCNVCDLQLTGRLHAESHYMGKNHQKAIMGFRSPAGSGYYDNNGKWIRTKQIKANNGTNDTIGSSFLPISVELKAPPSGSLKRKRESQGPPVVFHCDICDINTTCQEQLDNHYKGQKHLKKLKQLGLIKIEPPVASNLYQTVYSSAALSPVNMINSGFAIDENDLNLSVYRTPSGDYYCPVCNLTTNSEDKFIQHLKSKSHVKKATQKKGSRSSTYLKSFKDLKFA